MFSVISAFSAVTDAFVNRKERKERKESGLPSGRQRAHGLVRAIGVYFPLVEK
jgi:hypothetical protein